MEHPQLPALQISAGPGRILLRYVRFALGTDGGCEKPCLSDARVESAGSEGECAISGSDGHFARRAHGLLSGSGVREAGQAAERLCEKRNVWRGFAESV